MIKKLENIEVKNNKIVLFIFVFLYLIGMILCSAYTSPLYSNYFGADSALFTLIGKGITEGKIVYKDLFDHKGPLLFFIEALGYFIGKSTGIFIIQCTFGIINLFLLYKIWKKIRNVQNSKSVVNFLFIFITTYTYFFFVFEKGNLSEEYSLPFISLCLFLFAKYANNINAEAKHPYCYSFVYGASFMSLALIRVNNAATVIAGVLTIILYLIYKKEYFNLLINFIFGVLGCVVAFIPFGIYFGYNHALNDMIYATFFYNLKYAVNTGYQSVFSNLPKYIILYFPILCSILMVFLKVKKTREFNFFDFMIVSIVVLNTICLLISNAYAHYFTIFVPVFALILSRYFVFKRKDIKTTLVILCILLNIFAIIRVIGAAIYTNFVSGSSVIVHNVIEEETKQIPIDERDSVIGYNIPCSYYLHADITPCYKYYTHQEWWSKNDPTIKSSFMKRLNSGEILWLLTLPNENDGSICQIISNKYVLKTKTNYFNIYRLKK